MYVHRGPNYFVPYSGKFSLVKIFIYLTKKPTINFHMFQFCKSYQTMPMQLTYCQKKIALHDDLSLAL